MATIYHYDPTSGQLLGAAEARKSPKDGVILIPRHATDVAPPSDVASGHVAVFHEETWSVVEDHRGASYWVEGSDAERVMHELGPMPDGALLEPPTFPKYRDMHQALAALVSGIEAAMDVIVASISGRVPKYESNSWPSKAAAARKYLAGGGPAELILQKEADQRGVSVDVVAQRISENADRFESLVGTATAIRLEAVDLIENEADPHKYEDIINIAVADVVAAATLL